MDTLENGRTGSNVDALENGQTGSKFGVYRSAFRVRRSTDAVWSTGNGALTRNAERQTGNSQLASLVPIEGFPRAKRETGNSQRASPALIEGPNDWLVTRASLNALSTLTFMA